MKFIPEKKIELYLKLGKELACFVKVDSYFESRTFDWISLKKCDSNYEARLIRSFDEGDEIFTDVKKFERLNELDEFENKSIQGDFETIKQWILKQFNIKMDKFHQLNELNFKYLELVKENKLGTQLKHIK